MVVNGKGVVVCKEGDVGKVFVNVKMCVDVVYE